MLLLPDEVDSQLLHDGCVYLASDGSASMSIPKKISLKCPSFDFTAFPNDQQTCNMNLESWKYSEKQQRMRFRTRPLPDARAGYQNDDMPVHAGVAQNISLFPGNTSPMWPTDVALYKPHMTWQLESINASENAVFFKCCPDTLWSDLEWSFTFRRAKFQ